MSEISEYYDIINEQLEDRGFSYYYIAKKLNLGQNNGSVYFNNKTKTTPIRPNRNVTISLAFLFGFDILETNYLLEKGFLPKLNTSFKRDVLIKKGLKERLNLDEMNSILQENGFDDLKKEGKWYND